MMRPAHSRVEDESADAARNGLHSGESARKLQAGRRRARRNNLGQVMGEKGQSTRTKLLSIIRQLLEQSGRLQSLRVGEISRRAKVSQSSFYSYFANIEQAALEVIREAADAAPNFPALLAERWDRRTAFDQAHALVDVYIHYWTEYGAILWVRNTESDQGNTEFFAERMRTTMPILYAIERKLCEHWELSPGRQPETLAVAGAVFAGLERLAQVTFRASLIPERFPREALIDAEAHVIATLLVFGRPGVRFGLPAFQSPSPSRGKS